MRTLSQLLMEKLDDFQREWSKARRHMFAEEQPNMDYWRAQTVYTALPHTGRSRDNLTVAPRLARAAGRESCPPGSGDCLCLGLVGAMDCSDHPRTYDEEAHRNEGRLPGIRVEGVDEANRDGGDDQHEEHDRPGAASLP
jgi:hypothetical protein